jgi:hypothetical protein
MHLQTNHINVSEIAQRVKFFWIIFKSDEHSKQVKKRERERERDRRRTTGNDAHTSPTSFTFNCPEPVAAS